MSRHQVNKEDITTQDAELPTEGGFLSGLCGLFSDSCPLGVPGEHQTNPMGQTWRARRPGGRTGVASRS
ncbi:hypothetical protein AALO_G00098370 [Alosa alosa]|uniref:Uncharacterized protein n=1 Tax=Alosa alosa TaxID=278164 RepID=A0AAV6GXJ5_9TELE|nr:hypothetical protein AALO_G00098370 [Alosa alosa]